MKTEEIKHAYADWKNAMMKGDLTVLEKIYCENFLWTNTMGITNNKEENLNKISSGNLRYVSWINEDMTIDMLGGDIGILKTREIFKNDRIQPKSERYSGCYCHFY